VLRLARALVLVVVAVVVVPMATASTVLAAFLFLPLPAALPDPRQQVGAQVSRVFDADGNLIGTFEQFDLSEPVARDDIPQVLRDAVVAAEDRRFYTHDGVDLRGMFRALWTDIRAGEAVQGGSTITQQYVKNAYTGSDRTLVRKVREAILARQLDRQFDKDEILYKYLQQVYFGEGAYGVGAAAQTYFRKSVRDLTVSEAALLAGLIPAPSYYEPRGNPEAAEAKRLIVLEAMHDQGMLTPEEYLAAAQQSVFVAAFGPPTDGLPHTIVHLRDEAPTRYPYFLDYVERYVSFLHGEGAVYRGLDIYTTLDPEMQLAAEESVGATLDGTEPPIEMSLVAVEPQTGFVKALVGGRDFYAPGGQVNLALGAAGGGSGRQPGSTFKPFVLATALEEGMSPDTRYPGRDDICFPSVPEEYCAHNYGNSSYGTLDLRTATAKSVNTVYVQLFRDVGGKDVFDVARRLGVGLPEWDDARFGLAAALGTESVSPLDMASAYGVFAARGERANPTPVIKVLDADGVVIEDHTTPHRDRVLQERSADTMNDVLRHVFDSGSTAAGRGIGRPAAGKTGTTQENSNAWFVGYTPALSTAVWIGRRDDQRPMGTVKGVTAVTGGTLPARTWQDFMGRALEGVAPTDFTEPAPEPEVTVSPVERARGGFDPGTRRRPSDAGDGSVPVEALPPPAVDPPPTSTTTTTSTTLVIPADDGGGDDGPLLD
jgi:penicillin-binding protein 1A